MKLFGSGNSGKHIKSNAENNAEITYEHAAPEVNAEISDKKARKKKRRRITLIVVLAIIVAAVVGCAIWMQPPSINNDTRDENTQPPVTEDPLESTDPEPEETPEEDDSLRKSGCYTFLAMGKDYASDSTDTILVGRLDTVNGTLNIVHIPRDTLVNVPWSVKKINSVYSAGNEDIEYMKDHIADLLGFGVDFYAVIDIASFEKLVDAIGGVYFDVPINMYYDDPAQNLHIAINKGYQYLDGENALKVVRFRMGNNGTGYPDGDIGRINTQQAFLKSVASQMLTLGNIPNLSKVLEIFEEYVETDLTYGNMAWLAKEFLKLDGENINFMTVPGDTGCSIRGGSYVSIYLDDWIKMINECINPFKIDIIESQLDVLTYSGGVFYATRGEIAGGENSFYDYYAVLNSSASFTGEETGETSGDELDDSGSEPAEEPDAGEIEEPAPDENIVSEETVP